MNDLYLKGRGAQSNPNNKFSDQKYITDFIEGLDEPISFPSSTEFFKESPKKIISVSNSPDINLSHSINPYQGCEHGCIYCYARNAHQYYGLSAGLDFERKIMYKPDAAQLLMQQFEQRNYKVQPILLSGNTDCYQPAEKKFRITKSLLEVFLRYQHPVSIITKNNLILRDIALLKELNDSDLVHVNISITTLNESLRQKLEPRTVTGLGRLKVIEVLSKIGIPVRVMVAPIIPGLNSMEIPRIIQSAASAGAQEAGFTIVRLNGEIGDIFRDWVWKAYPNSAEKVLHQIEACHAGNLNDSRWGKRISGDGIEADAIHQLFNISVRNYMPNKKLKPYRLDLFRTSQNQLSLF